jgi:sec-independent protein translocase protein TatB
MFDVGFWEISLIAVIALIILGPERLPKVARTAGLWIGKGRRMFADVKRDIDRELREAEVADLKDLGDELKKTRTEVEAAAQKSGVEEEGNTILNSIKESAEAIKDGNKDSQPS